MTIKNISRTILALFFGTFAYAMTAQGGEIGEYSCCGNEESAIQSECRYLDRGQTCSYDADCGGDTYGACCSQACVKQDN